MRIAQVAPLFESVPPKLYGGTERVVSWLTEDLVCAGHEVTLFASGDSLTQARLVSTCPEALRLNQSCVDPWPQHIVMLNRIVKERHNFDLIHFHWDYLHYPSARREELVHLTTQHGRLDIADLVPMYRTFPEMPVVSISDAQRAPLPWLNWKGTVHHGLPKHSLQAFERPGKYLAFLGRTSPEKGLDRAIAVAKAAGIPLKIAAKIDKVDRDYFETCIKPLLDDPLVEFIGEIGHEEKNEFLGNAIALLFPIAWPEPFGLVMIEAMACGTPVIAFRHGSVAEVVKDGVTGFIVNGVAGAVQAVARVDEIDRAGCRRHFERNFTATRMAQDYLRIYQKIVAVAPEPIDVPEGVMSWSKLTLPSSTT
jgi:glycosyltransferase involved in cell wall biosynthesis